MSIFTTDYLNKSAEKFANKVAFKDINRELTYSELKEETLKIATAIINLGFRKSPVAVYLDKSVSCISAFMGTTYSGNFYSPLDTKMPIGRIEKIIDTLNPVIIITDLAHKNEAETFSKGAKILVYEELQNGEIDAVKVENTVSKIIDTDIAYILFTSGSTGVPKGVILSQRAIVDFTEWGSFYLNFDDSVIFGNQTPFYFSMSTLDIYQTLRNGGTLCIIPTEYFSVVTYLMEYLHDNKVNTLNWVPSALNIVSALRALRSPYLEDLKIVFFSGEVMPTKQLNKWIKEYPDVRFINLYGPTEVADTCTAYEVNRKFENTEKIPMGTACRNMEILLLDENDKLVTDGGIGEVCVRGNGIASGYYNAPEKTKEVFVQNPLHNSYPEVVYRTGDLAQYNEYGELVYCSRKDFQIKHMGHRIELGEIESVISAIEEVNSCCCLYNIKKQRIVLYYTGDISQEEIQEHIKDNLPEYMAPNKKIHLDEMPINLNGKIDRQKLKEMEQG